jgi:hypothetical protein
VVPAAVVPPAVIAPSVLPSSSSSSLFTSTSTKSHTSPCPNEWYSTDMPKLGSNPLIVAGVYALETDDDVADEELKNTTPVFCVREDMYPKKLPQRKEEVGEKGIGIIRDFECSRNFAKDATCVFKYQGTAKMMSAMTQPLTEGIQPSFVGNKGKLSLEEHKPTVRISQSYNHHNQ